MDKQEQTRPNTATNQTNESTVEVGVACRTTGRKGKKKQNKQEQKPKTTTKQKPW
jgi:hypothetical protein